VEGIEGWIGVEEGRKKARGIWGWWTAEKVRGNGRYLGGKEGVNGLSLMKKGNAKSGAVVGLDEENARGGKAKRYRLDWEMAMGEKIRWEVCLMTRGMNLCLLYRLVLRGESEGAP